MMRFVRTLGILALSLSLLTGAALSEEEDAGEIVLAQTKQPARSAPRYTGVHVYILRGWLDIFSTGMDDLGVKLNRRGIRASVHGHAEYHSLAERIIEQYRSGVRPSVVIIGHSLGANAAVQMAAVLGQQKISVPLVITYDPTVSLEVPANVRRLVNFYSPDNGWGTPIARGAGFRGTLNNVNLSGDSSIGHTDIDKSPRLHARSIAYIQSIGGGARAASGTARTKSGEKDQESRAPSTDAQAAAKESAPDSAAEETAKSEADGDRRPDAKASDVKAVEVQDTSDAATGSAAAPAPIPASASPATEPKPAAGDEKSEAEFSGSKSSGGESQKTETAASPEAASAASN